MAKKEILLYLFTILWIPQVALSQEANTNNTHCADVIGATATPTSPNTFTVSATVSSPYETGWDQYADAWQIVVVGDGDDAVEMVLGTRTLGHPHVNEQPFTRTLNEVEIPYGTVMVRARDSINGYCGETFVLQVDVEELVETTAPNTTTTTAKGSNTKNESPTVNTEDNSVITIGSDDSGTDMLVVGMATSVFLAFLFLSYF